MNFLVKAGRRSAKCAKFQADRILNEWLHLGLISLLEFYNATVEEIND